MIGENLTILFQNGKFAVVGSYDGRCVFYTTEHLKYYTQIHVRSTRGRNSKGRKITGIESLPNEDKVSLIKLQFSIEILLYFWFNDSDFGYIQRQSYQTLRLEGLEPVLQVQGIRQQFQPNPCMFQVIII